jgi:hypothetical protein
MILEIHSPVEQFFLLIKVFKFFKRNSFSNLPKEANCKRLDKKKLGK